MTDEEYIRKAVELAEGWSSIHIYDGEDYAAYFDSENKLDIPDIEFRFDKPTQCGLDALAAQLVRQVDDPDNDIEVRAFMNCTAIVQADHMFGDENCLSEHVSPDRTMNSIRAIVGSGVLDRE